MRSVPRCVRSALTANIDVVTRRLHALEQSAMPQRMFMAPACSTT